MRCPLDGCGPHCSITPEGQRHIPLRTHHLTELIKHVDDGSKLDSHKDVPERLQQQLYAEEHQSKKRKAKAADDGPSDSRQPININLLNNGLGDHPQSNAPLPTPSRVLFRLPECADNQLKEYVDWQVNRHANPTYKEGFEAAFEAATSECMSLSQIEREKDLRYFCDRNVPRGVAWTFMHQVRYWSWESNKKALNDESLYCTVAFLINHLTRSYATV